MKNLAMLPREQDVSSWHPRLRELHRYWIEMHPAIGLPGRQHFDPLHVPHLLPQLWLLEVQRAPFRLRYRVAGTRVVELAGQELTGRWLDEAHPHLRVNNGLARFERVVETGVPDWRRGKPKVFLAHMDYAEIENCLFPLARNGATVDMILVYTVFYRPDGTEL